MKEIARRNRRTPRVTNHLLRRVRDYAQIKGDGIITKEMAIKALKILMVNYTGLVSQWFFLNSTSPRLVFEC